MKDKKGYYLSVLLFTVCFFFLNHYLFPAKSIFETQNENTETAAIEYKQETKEAPLKSIALDTEASYVLENAHFTLLFSKNGNLRQIYLPMQTHSAKSLIKPTSIDYELGDLNPYVDVINSERKESQFSTKNFYPMLRSNQNHEYEAFSLTNSTPFELIEHSDKHIVFKADNIKKTYTLTNDPFVFDVKLEFDEPQTDLWLASGMCDSEVVANSVQSFIKYGVQKKGEVETKDLTLPEDKSLISSLQYHWLSISNGPFGMIVQPKSTQLGLMIEKIDSKKIPSKLATLSTPDLDEKLKTAPGYLCKFPVSNQTQVEFKIFAGPYQNNLLKQINPLLLDAQNNQGFLTSISKPFSRILFYILEFFYNLTHSWGLSIILLTIALRLMLYPLNAWSIKQNLKTQKLSPQVKVINEKYKKDKQKRSIETMKLYRKEGANPLTGCFPILIQMPFLLGMFDLLKNTFQLRGASFIPGWITNLSEPDTLFSWGFSIIFIGTSFHLLPVLNGIAMFFQQRFSSSLPKDPSQWTDQQRQQRTMGTLMPLFITFAFYNFPAGLNLYWLSSTILGVGQQYLMKKLSKK
ncbi:MAG: Membrane protein insertase YidC [Chlamydiae bacterium]|nr:Membrane protein insertase YidC [Chlamydiota bacterium]